MIKSITVTNYLGDSIELELTRPDKSGFIIKDVTGLGPTNASVKMTKNASSDGEVYNSSTLEKRNIVFELEFLDSRNETIEDVRLKSYKYFPINTEVELLIKTDRREVTTTGIVESNEPNIFSQNEGCSISILCPDPYLYSLESTETVFSGVTSEFGFEFCNDSLSEDLLQMGSIEYKTENIVSYDGEVPVGVTIVIHTIGEVGDITMYNLTTKESMKLDTYKINYMLYPEWYLGEYIEPVGYRGFMHANFTKKRVEINGESHYVLVDKKTGDEYYSGELIVGYENALYRYVQNSNTSLNPEIKPSPGATTTSGVVVWEKVEEMPLPAGDTIIITTGRGNKSITLLRDGVSTNILNCLDRNTSWFTLRRGDNRFVYEVESGSENVQFHIGNKIVYLGV